MKTIRIKLFFVFTVFTATLVFLGILLNAAFLEEYYIYKNESILEQAAREISQEYNKNPVGIETYLNVFDRASGINCTIVDSNLNSICNSFPERQDTEASRLPGEIEQIIKENRAFLENEPVYQVLEKPENEPPKLIHISRVESGDIVILRKSMKGIRESVDIANQFYILAGLMLVVVGGLFMFYLSKRVTAPIIEMSKVAESISKLEFDRRVAFESSDELGSLGRSINEMAEELNNSMNALCQDVERRKQLVRNISHELKTPIGVVKGYAEGLKYGVAENKEMGNKYCSVIAEECDRMDSLVQELLNMSMLESGAFQIQSARIDLGELVWACASRFEPVLAEKGIHLVVKQAGELVVNGDPELLERIMNNYMINAIEHVDASNQIEMAAEESGSAVRISVHNSGPTIPEDEFEQIWDVFYKADKARTRQYGGHGLGLSIVKLIAELHGGSAGVINTDDGVLFFADIPNAGPTE